MGNLRFILSNPVHHIYTDSDGVLREDLVFYSPAIDKECGDILISHEYHNNQHGDQFATHWETINVASEDYVANRVEIWHRTEALDAAIHKWSKGTSEENWTALITIDRIPSLTITVTLPHEHFSHLPQINWKEKIVSLSVDTNQSLKELKIPLVEEDKISYREGKESFLSIDPHFVAIRKYRMEIKCRPECMKEVSDESWRLNVLSRLLRFAFGR